MESQVVKFAAPFYRDFYFRIAISILAAHSIIAFGIERSIWELLLMSAYYRSLAGSFFIAFTLISTIRYVTIKLDRTWPWGKNNLVRALYQFSFGVVLVSAVAFMLAAIYFKLQGVNILQTVYLKYDFPVIVTFLVLVNTYYFAYYQYLLNKIPAAQQSSGEEKKYKVLYMVTEGMEKIPVNISTISSFYRDGKYNWLQTHDGKTYLHDTTLDETEQDLDPFQFYRANRQVIVNHDACKSYQLLEYGKLELLLEPALAAPVVISQKRAADFKRWMDR